MAVHSISYWYCGNRRQRYFGFNDSSGNITAHASDPGMNGLPWQDDVYNAGTTCRNDGYKLFQDANWKVYVDGSYPYAYVEDIGTPPDPPPPPPNACNLFYLTQLQVMTNESIAGAYDGTISVSTRDSVLNSIVKVNLNSDFNYASEGVTGTVINGYDTQFTFTGLAAGTYYVYARSSSSCMKIVGAVVGLDGGAGGIGGGDGDGGSSDTGADYPKYKLSFNDLDGNVLAENKYKLEIIEQDYTGDVYDLTGGSSPVIVSWRNESNEDPFTPVIPSELQVNIISETDQQFLEFITYDERQYKGKFYEYVSGAYTLKWVGWMLPMSHTEQYYTESNYPIDFSFVDFGGLSDKPFVTSGGTIFEDKLSFLLGIRACLYHTGINMEIYESANIYTSTMDSSEADSPLTQMFFDPKVYLDDDGEPMDCRTVLDSLLTNIGCRIYQSDGRWNIELITEKLASSVLTRKYDFNGVYYGYENLSPRIALRKGGATIPSPKVAFRDISQVLNIPINYGTIKVVYDLGLETVNNLLLKSSFDPVDGVNGQYEGWQVIPSTNASWSLYKLTEKRGESESALQISFIGTDYNNYVDIVSTPVPIVWPGKEYTLNIKFDVYARPTYTKAHTYLDYSVGINDNKILLIPGENTETIFTSYNSLAGWVDNIYNRMFIESSLQWIQVNINARIPAETIAAISTDGNLVFQIRVRSNSDFDVDTITALKAVETNPFTTNGKINAFKYQKVRVRDGSFIRVYNLEDGTESESSPDVIRPNDYGTNAYRIWKLNYTVATTGQNWLQNILLTNISIGYFPSNSSPIESITKAITLNNNINREYTKTVLHGDITTEMDENYKHIVSGALTYSSGAHISGAWTRKGAGENKYLHELLASMYQGQFLNNRWRLTGNLINSGVSVSFFNTFQEYRTGRIYLQASSSIDLKNKSISTEIIEALKGDVIPDVGTPTPDPIEPPVITREHTNEFTNEFK